MVRGGTWVELREGFGVELRVQLYKVGVGNWIPLEQWAVV